MCVCVSVLFSSLPAYRAATACTPAYTERERERKRRASMKQCARETGFIIENENKNVEKIKQQQ